VGDVRVRARVREKVRVRVRVVVDSFQIAPRAVGKGIESSGVLGYDVNSAQHTLLTVTSYPPRGF
jgi:hypothetical protein